MSLASLPPPNKNPLVVNRNTGERGTAPPTQQVRRTVCLVGRATAGEQDESKLLVPPTPWQPPTLCEACGAKPKGTPQVDVGPPFIWGNVGGGGRGVVCIEQLPKV